MEENQIADSFLTEGSCREGLQTVLDGYMRNPELATLLYENLPYIRIEDLEDAVAFAAAGNERALLRLLAHRRKC